LKANEYTLLDTQFINDNVLRYGAIEIPRTDYMERLKKALQLNRKFLLNPLQTSSPKHSTF